jgi:RNA polymerase primary sigma factor
MRTLFFEKSVPIGRGKGNFFNILPPVFSRKEERRAFQELEKHPNNLNVRNEIIVRNLKLVYKIAEKLEYLREQYGLEFGDSLGYGLFGLFKAVQLFNWRRGYKFSTYATAWVYQYIKYFIRNNGSLIKRSIRYADWDIKRKRLSQKVNQELISDAADTELVKRKIFSRREIEKIKNNNFSIISLDSCFSVNDKDGRTLIDISGLEEKGYQTVEEKDNRERILAFLAKHLNEKERVIVEKRIGLKDGVVWTLDEIGRRIFNVSRERVRQIQDKAFEKIKKCEDRAILKQLLI